MGISSAQSLKLIAHAFENQVSTGGEWHRIFLLRLSQPVEGIRPAFLSEESLDLLNPLRSFRHMVRHAYGTDIKLNQLEPNIEIALHITALISQDIDQFVAALRDLVD